MKSDVIEQEIAELERKYKAELDRLDKKRWVLEHLPDPIDENWMPRIFISTVNGLAESVRLTFGDRSGSAFKFRDTEVSILMEQYPPLPMVMVKDHTRNWRVTDQDTWNDLNAGGDNVLSPGDEARARLLGTRPVPTDAFITPVAPFRMEAEESHGEQSLAIVWYTRLGKDTVARCAAFLDAYRDPAEWDTDRISYDKNGNPTRRRATRGKFIPNVAGTYEGINWWSPPDTFKTTIYWPWPSDDDRTWGNVIDCGPRNEARE